MKEYIEREAALSDEMCEGISCQECPFLIHPVNGGCKVVKYINGIPAADVVEIPTTGIGDLSDGYHTFNGLYYQRMILFAALVKQNKDRAWKSYRHEDGELCFGGGWFIVGIDTLEGSYTYHYESKNFDLFDCEELPVGKHWDGHTEADVTRLLSLPATAEAEEARHGDWEEVEVEYSEEVGVPPSLVSMRCNKCNRYHTTVYYGGEATHGMGYCPHCGCKMKEV